MTQTPHCHDIDFIDYYRLLYSLQIRGEEREEKRKGFISIQVQYFTLNLFHLMENY